MPIIPSPKHRSPVIGASQNVCSSADHPYHQNDTGIKNEKKTQTLSLTSGIGTLLFCFVCFAIMRSLVLPITTTPSMKPMPKPM